MSNVDLTSIVENIRSRDYYLKRTGKNNRMISKKKIRMLDGALVSKNYRDLMTTTLNSLYASETLEDVKNNTVAYFSILNAIMFGSIFDNNIGFDFEFDEYGQIQDKEK